MLLDPAEGPGEAIAEDRGQSLLEALGEERPRGDREDAVGAEPLGEVAELASDPGP